MKFHTLLNAALPVALLTGFASTSYAQTQTPARVRGAVVSLNGNDLTVKGRGGKDEHVKLADGFKVIAVEPAKMEDIKPGTFIGTAASGTPGHETALEVVVFPESMRGMAEGHYDWDLIPGSSMTNGNVDGEVSASNQRELTVSYKGGTSKIAVPPNVPVVKLSPAENSMITPGVKVFVPGHREADGSIAAPAVLVGKNGLTPPM